MAAPNERQARVSDVDPPLNRHYADRKQTILVALEAVVPRGVTR